MPSLSPTQFRNERSKMKRILLALTLLCSTAFAVEPKPSEASVKELLAITGAAKVLDGIWVQMDGMMKTMITQARQGRTLTATQQAAVDEFRSQSMAVLREELTWTKLEPVYVRIYQDSLNQDEIDGMIAFYKTPAGQAVIRKVPVILQKTMTEMPGLMAPMMQKLQQLQKDILASLQTIGETK